MNPRKQLKFYYRYLTSPHRWRKWFKPPVTLVVIAFAIFLAALVWTPSFSAHQAGTSTTPSATQTLQAPAEPTRTPLPAEFVSNRQQTIGITFAGAVLVLIVVIGLIVYLPKKID